MTYENMYHGADSSRQDLRGAAKMMMESSNEARDLFSRSSLVAYHSGQFSHV